MTQTHRFIKILRTLGQKDYEVKKVYRRMCDQELFVIAYGNLAQNSGRLTAGPDGETIDGMSIEKIDQIIKMLKANEFSWQPVTRTYIPKANGKTRPLGMPCMIDRAHQALHLLALDPIAETKGDLNSYGFRQGRSAADAIGQLFLMLSRKNSAQWVLEGDIKACFDELSHDWLEKHIPTDKRSLREWLKAGYMENAVFHTTEAGSPQGGIISPVVANLAFDGLETLLHQTFPRHQRMKICLARYADDFVITGATKAVLQEQVMPLVQAFLRERGLALSLEKTTITHI